jgi:hypothetical protein
MDSRQCSLGMRLKRERDLFNDAFNSSDSMTSTADNRTDYVRNRGKPKY